MNTRIKVVITNDRARTRYQEDVELGQVVRKTILLEKYSTRLHNVFIARHIEIFNESLVLHAQPYTAFVSMARFTSSPYQFMHNGSELQFAELLEELELQYGIVNKEEIAGSNLPAITDTSTTDSTAEQSVSEQHNAIADIAADFEYLMAVSAEIRNTSRIIIGLSSTASKLVAELASINSSLNVESPAQSGLRTPRARKTAPSTNANTSAGQSRQSTGNDLLDILDNSI